MVTKRILLEKENASGTLAEVIRVWKVMKLVSIISLAFVMSIGCGEPNLENPKVRERILAQAIDYRNIQNRSTPSGEELAYAPNQNHPYTGWVKGSGPVMYEISDAVGAIGFLIHAQGGKPNVYISWYPNGQISEKGTFRNFKRNGVWTRWYENSQKYEEGTYKNDEKDGLWIQWSEDGEEVSRETY